MKPKQSPLSSTPSKILVVDDDQRLRALLDQYLREHGFDVLSAQDSAEARKILGGQSIDLIILDRMMPQESGLEFTTDLRAQGNSVPILMLTAMGETDDRIDGLEQGVDDYLSKPFEPKELLLRMGRILARTSVKAAPQNPKPITFGEHAFDLESKKLLKNQETVYLTSVEQSLLEIFAKHLGKPLSREELAEQSGACISPRTVDVQITRLRRKLERNPKKPLYLRTVRHKGYALWSDAQKEGGADVSTV